MERLSGSANQLTNKGKKSSLEMEMKKSRGIALLYARLEGVLLIWQQQ